MDYYVPYNQPSTQAGCGNQQNQQFPVGMGYVPWQVWGQTYPLDRGFQVGTIFPDLDYAFYYGRCRS